MSYFDDASLVMIPSGYKTSKVYSVKPTDGSGDLAFTRSNDTATRVGPNGLIEKVRTNLITYSNDFTNAAYSKITDGTYTITSETITDPFGNSVSVKKVTLTSGGYLVLRNTLGSATTSPTTGSVYIKKTVSTTGVDTDLSDGGVAVSANNTNWQRLVSINPASVYGSGTFLDINITTVNEPVYVAYAQIELSDFGATDYIATTSAAVSVGPVANVPRLDYLNSSCPRLLLEPQRTNSLTYSEQLNNAAWTTNNSTISANVTATLDPSGYNGADKLQETATTADHNVGSETITALSGQVVTFSVFLKAAERTWAAIRLYDGNGSKFAYFNLSTGAVGSVTAGATSAISSYGNGWYRCAITTTMASNTVTLPFVSTATADGTRNFAGTAGSGIYCFGFQQEIGAYATSYIPTLGAAVTRGADAASKTGISSLIGQTAGTLYAEYNIDGTNTSGRIIAVSDGTTANRIALLNDGGSIRIFVASAGVAQVDISFGTWIGSHKIAVAYANNDLVVFLDGVSVATDTSISVPACSAAQVGTFEDNTNITPLGGGIKQALLFKTRLSNSSLAELTSL